MERLKRNLGAKLAAGIVFVVSSVFMVLSALFGIIACEGEIYKPGGVEEFREYILYSIAQNYEYRALGYYNSYIIKGDDVDKEYFEEYFSEDNCNYAFKIEPLNDADSKYPVLKNYDCENYQYSYSLQHAFDIFAGHDEFTFDISKEDIYNDYVEENEDVYPEYFNGEYYINEVDEEYFITNGEIEYRLNDNPDFKKAYAEFKDRLESRYSRWELYSTYDEAEERFILKAEGYDYVYFKITSYVKADLTAHDAFYSSILLKYYDKYIDIALNAAIPVFIISLILAAVCVVFLIAAAGHRKGTDGVSENLFDRIPYDVLLAGYGCIIAAFLAAINGYYFYDIIVPAVAAAALAVCLIPVMLVTTSTRIKTREIFRNTVIFKILKWVLGIIKRIFAKLTGVIKYLWHNLNIYARFMGVFVIIAFLELLVIAATGVYNMGALFICWFFEKLILGFVLAVAVINMNRLKVGAAEIAKGNIDYEIDTDKMFWEFKIHGDNLNSIRDGIQDAVEERMKSERMKTELITNVSHDIKTPLTSIISYVDLLKKENIDSDKAEEYIEVLDRQSARLKKLISDLIDASKASTGNMQVELAETDIRVLLEQALGEFAEKLDKRGLRPVISYQTDNTMAIADGKLLWRTFDNLINNIVKYAQDNTRVYIDLENENHSIDDGSGYIKRAAMIKVTFKNISKEELNVSGDELMERFVRGDSSRNTEGSGLGLSIAKSLVEIQNGKLEIVVDGDLFKVVLLLVRA